MTTSLSPQEFVAKWRNAALKESAAYQEHFTDLCRLLGHPTPAHRKLDAAVFAAYGWPHDVSDEEILARLLALNRARAARSHTR